MRVSIIPTSVTQILAQIVSRARGAAAASPGAARPHPARRANGPVTFKRFYIKRTIMLSLLPQRLLLKLRRNHRAAFGTRRER